MKKIIFSSLILILTSLNVNAQKFYGLDKSPMDISAYPSSYRISKKIVKVIYSRPQLKGRKLSSLTPKGKIWRTGANESTEIIFYKDVNFGGKPLKAGTYSLFTIPNDKQWTIILNRDLNTWGAYFYNKENDVIRVKVNTSIVKKEIEAFSIKFEGNEKNFNMFLGWGNVIITVPITL